MIQNTTDLPFEFSQWINQQVPNNTNLIASFAKALYLKIENFQSNLFDGNVLIDPEKIPESEYFSHQENSQNSCCKAVGIEEISYFLMVLNNELQFNSENLVLTMVYMNKFWLSSKIPFMNSNWKNVLLMSAVTAQTILDSDSSFSLDLNKIQRLCFSDIRLMKIEYLNFISYNYKIEKKECVHQLNYLQDISKSLNSGSLWHVDGEKLKNAIKRSKFLTQESDRDCEIYHSEAICSIDIDEINL